MGALRKKPPRRMRAALLRWLGVPVNPATGEFWRDYYGGQEAGATVNVDNALQLDAVWSCVRLISETIATLPLSMYESAGGGRRVARDHGLQMLIHDQPNRESSAAVFWEAVVAAMLLRGNACVEKLMAGSRVVGLRFLDPERLDGLRPVRSQTVQWRYRDDDGKLRVIPNTRMWVIPGFSLDGQHGVSVIRYGAKVFGGAMAARNASNKTFENGMLQNVYYKIDAWLKPEQREQFKKNLAGSVERGEMPLLEGGTSVNALGINPVDAQLLETMSFSVEAICRWFRVPPWMVGKTEKSTSWGTGIEQQMIGFLTFTLAPWLRRIEQAISKDLLSPAERRRYYPKFSVEGLLRADSKARAEFYGVMVDKGIMTRDEVRALEDREPLGGNAAELTVQANMTTLDAIGQPPQE